MSTLREVPPEEREPSIANDAELVRQVRSATQMLDAAIQRARDAGLTIQIGAAEKWLDLGPKDNANPIVVRARRNY